jgi:hypothetical protein
VAKENSLRSSLEEKQRENDVLRQRIEDEQALSGKMESEMQELNSIINSYKY